METKTRRVLADSVERIHYAATEVQDVARAAALQMFPDLRQRPSLPVSLRGAGVAELGRDVVILVPDRVLDDVAVRKVARLCPQLWLDGRWFPADLSRIHVLLVKRMQLIDGDGIDPTAAALLDVPADVTHFVRASRGTADILTAVDLRWRSGRPWTRR